MHLIHQQTVRRELHFFKAVSEGVRDFQAICIVGGKDGKLTEYTAPCGVCRQVMMEFCNPKTFQIILAVDKERYENLYFRRADASWVWTIKFGIM